MARESIEELIRLVRAQPLTAEQCKDLYDFIATLIETNHALQQHAHQVQRSVLVEIIESEDDTSELISKLWYDKASNRRLKAAKDLMWAGYIEACGAFGDYLLRATPAGRYYLQQEAALGAENTRKADDTGPPTSD